MDRRTAAAGRPLYDIKPKQYRDSSFTKVKEKRQPAGRVHLVNADNLIAMVHDLVEQVADFNVRLEVIEGVALPNQDIHGEMERVERFVAEAVRRTKQVENIQKDAELRRAVQNREIMTRMGQLEYLIQCSEDQRKVIEPKAKHKNIFEYCKMVQKEVMDTSTELAKLREEVTSLGKVSRHYANPKDLSTNFNLTPGPLTIGDLAVSRDPRVDAIVERLDLLEAAFEDRAISLTEADPAGHVHGSQQPAGMFELLTSPTHTQLSDPTTLKLALPKKAYSHGREIPMVPSASEHDEMRRREAEVLLKEELLQQREAAIATKLKQLQELEGRVSRNPTPSATHSTHSDRELETQMRMLDNEEERVEVVAYSQPAAGPTPAVAQSKSHIHVSKPRSDAASEKSVRSQRSAVSMGSKKSTGKAAEKAGAGLEAKIKMLEQLEEQPAADKLSLLEEAPAEQVRKGSKGSSVASTAKESTQPVEGRSLKNPAEEQQDIKSMNLASLLDALTSKPAVKSPSPAVENARSGSAYSRHTSSSSLTLDSIADDSPPLKKPAAVGQAAVPAPAQPTTRPTSLLNRPRNTAIVPNLADINFEDSDDSDPLTM